MCLDKLSLKDAKCIMTYGVNRLWSYTNERTNNTSYAVTIGLNLITSIDYLIVINNNNLFKVAYDYPLRYTENFKNKVGHKLYKLTKEKIND